LLKYILPWICTRISLDYALGMTDPGSKQIPMLFVKLIQVDWGAKEGDHLFHSSVRRDFDSPCPHVLTWCCSFWEIMAQRFQC
jgi:hypothetical protein